MRYENNTCPVCGLACDDIVLEVEGGEVKVSNACWLGKSKYMKYFNAERILNPTINDKQTTWIEAIKEVASLLSEASKPLIFMGTEVSTEAMYEGILLAEHLQGYVDSCTSVCHGPTIQALQEKGIPSASLGQVRNRADLVVFWGCNPVESHPRLMTKHAVHAPGEHIRGRVDRTVVVVDPRRSLTADQADLHIRVKPNEDYELLTALEMALCGYPPDEMVAGVPPELINKFAGLLSESEYCAFFVGLGLASSRGQGRNMEKAMQLIRVLNEQSRAVLLANRGHCNVAGFNELCTWITGYPYAVDFTRGKPRYNPGVSSAVDLLSRGEVDAMFVVGSDPIAHFPHKCARHMADISLITVEVSRTPTTELSDVVLPGVYDSIESGGTFYRMDNVPLHLRPTMQPPFDFTSSTRDTLNQLKEECFSKNEP